MSKIWVTSDWHFCHDRDFIYKPRGFSSVEEMNEMIIENHNKVVSPFDEVYCLGDCMLMNNEKGLDFIKKLNGKKYILRGNHDTEVRIREYASLQDVKYLGYATVLNYKKQKFYLSHYPAICSDYDCSSKETTFNLCGHRHTRNMFLDLDKGAILHVELDTNDCYPWSLDEIMERIM